MLDIATTSMGFQNVRVFCVGRKKDINLIESYFFFRKNQKNTVAQFIERFIQNNIYTCFVANNLKDKIIYRIFNNRILKKHGLLISFDEYMEAMCFSDAGKAELMKILHLSEQEVSEIVENSIWNELLQTQ